MLKLYAVRMTENRCLAEETGNSSEYYIVERSGESGVDGEIELEAFLCDSAAGADLIESSFCILNTTLDKAIMEGTEEIKGFLADRLLRGHIRVRYH